MNRAPFRLESPEPAVRRGPRRAGARLRPPVYGPLAGVKVLDTGRVVAGPWAATLLGDLGAEVVHVEGPPFRYPYADPTRVLSPTLPESSPPEDRVSESWVQYGRNKLSLGLDISMPEGKRVLRDLLRWADIWIDASRPGTFAQRGFPDAGVLRTNPRLVVVHVTGFGLTGRPEYLRRPSYDLVAQAFSGFLALQGEPEPKPPMRVSTALNDAVTGLGAAFAALAALHSSRRTGRGQVVDVAQYELSFLMLENMVLDYTLRGKVRERMGHAHPRLHPYELFRARDGWVVLAAPTPVAWRKVRQLIPLPADPRWDDMAWRVAHRRKVNAPLARFIRSRSVRELERLGVRHDVAFAPILDIREIARNPQYRAREMLLSWEDPVLGRVRGAGVAPKFQRTPGGVWRGAPWLGQDNVTVLRSILRYPSSRLRLLRERGVIGEAPPPRERGRSPA